MISHGFPILFATLSMFFAGLNDVVFKRYSTKDRSRGMYVLGIGIIWTVLHADTLPQKYFSRRKTSRRIRHSSWIL